MRKCDRPATGALVVFVDRPREASVSSDEVDDRDSVERGREPALVSVLDPMLDATEGCVTEGAAIAWISEAASSSDVGLRAVAADSDLRLLLSVVGTPFARAALAAIFSAICSATERPPSAESTSEVDEVMLDKRLRPHSTQPMSDVDRSRSKLLLALPCLSPCLTAGLAGDSGRLDIALSLPTGGEIGVAETAYRSGPHQSTELLRDPSLPVRCRSTDTRLFVIEDGRMVPLRGLVWLRFRGNLLGG